MTLDAIRALEQEPAPPFPDDGLDCFGWAPYDLDVFARLLDAAIAVAPGVSFLDAGCGLGTKCLLATERGLDAYGIDRVEAYVAQATRLGARAEVADVRDWARYGDFDVVYACHPLREPAETGFERWLHEQMNPGAVWMTLRGCVVPEGWREVVREDYQRHHHDPPRWRGVYVKPNQTEEAA
jgi:SAM-dependent methyltransferase